MDFYAVFIDLTKAFDVVNRKTLWVILTKLGCAQKFIQVIWVFQNSVIDLTLPSCYSSTPFHISKAWGRVVFFLSSFSTCSSPAYWTTNIVTLPVEYTWDTDRWLTIQPQKAEFKDKASWKNHYGNLVHWWLCSHGSLRVQTSNHCKQVFQSLSTLWSHNQSQEDCGYAPAYSRVSCNSSHPKYRWHSVEISQALQVSRKNNLFWLYSWQGDRGLNHQCQSIAFSPMLSCDEPQTHQAYNQDEGVQSSSIHQSSVWLVRCRLCTETHQNVWLL